jgi:hypothetical protein
MQAPHRTTLLHRSDVLCFVFVCCAVCCQVVQRVMLALFKTYEGTILASSHPSQLRTVLDTRAGRLYDGDALMQVRRGASLDACAECL